MMSHPIDLDALKAQLTRHEGLRLKPYRDTLGHLTIGVGRNLSEVGISEVEALALLDADIQTAIRGLDLRMPWWSTLDDVRRMALVDLAFNVGVEGVMSFRRMLIALRARQWDIAAAELCLSKWATQVQPSRRDTLAHMLRTGEC